MPAPARDRIMPAVHCRSFDMMTQPAVGDVERSERHFFAGRQPGELRHDELKIALWFEEVRTGLIPGASRIRTFCPA
jgi:hypothetical protein